MDLLLSFHRRVENLLEALSMLVKSAEAKAVALSLALPVTPNDLAAFIYFLD